MILPAWAITAWPYVKRALPFAAAALALWLAYGWAYDRGHDSRNSEVSALIEQRNTARANVVTLDAALARQNAAVADMGQRAADAQKRAGEALARAVAADKAAASLRARAGKLAKVAPVGPCVSEEGDKLSREAWSKL